MVVCFVLWLGNISHGHQDSTAIGDVCLNFCDYCDLKGGKTATSAN